MLAALAERLPAEAVVLEEAPVDRPEIHDRLLARQPLGFVSAAMGGLGFGVPAAAGLRMALPDRPVVAVIGDGASLYAIQGLVERRALPRGRALRDPLERRLRDHGPARGAIGNDGPWPGFGDIDIAALARGFCCPAQRVTTHDELVAALDEAIPTLAGREEPLLLDVVIAPTTTFAP